MKKLMVAALAVAAIGANVAFAEEDFGVESATPTVVDPITPTPGLLCSAYNLDGNFENKIAKLSTAPSIKNFVDTANTFGRAGIDKDIEVNLVRWQGFVKCKRAGVYSFSFLPKGNGYDYAFELNGEKLISKAYEQRTVTGKMKLGWNKIMIVYGVENLSSHIVLKYKPNESMSEPRPLTPSMLFYDKPHEDEW